MPPWALLVILAGVPHTAAAHIGPLHEPGFWAGLLHPLSGLDHLVAIFCVGVLSTRLTSAVPSRLHPQWSLPAVFLGAMALGAVLGLLGVHLPLATAMIALSVMLAGVALLAATDLPARLVMIAVALFALFHGYVHGAAMPAGGDATLFIGAALLAAALVYLIGIAVVHGVATRLTPRGEWLLRASGTGVLLFGASGMFA